MQEEKIMIETLYYAYLEGNEKLKSEHTEKLD